MNIEASEENFESLQQESLEKRNQDIMQENLDIINADLGDGNDQSAHLIHGKGIDCLYHDTKAKIIITTLSVFLAFAMTSSQVFGNRNIATESMTQTSSPAVMNINPPESFVEKSSYTKQGNTSEI